MKIELLNITCPFGTIEKICIEDAPENFNLNDFLKITVFEQDSPNIEMVITEPQQKDIPDIETTQIDLKIICDMFDEKFKANSARAYKTSIKKVLSLFPDDNVNDLFKNKIEEVIEKILSLPNSTSSKKSYLSSVVNVMKHFKFDNDSCKLLSDAIIKLCDQVKIEQAQKNTVNKKPIAEAYTALNQLVTYVGDDNELKRFSYFCTRHGVLRGSEFMTIMIMADDDHEHENYFNLEKQQLIIKNHKTVASRGTKVIDLTDEFSDMLRPHINRRFITNETNEAFETSAGLSKYIYKKLGYEIYDLRKMLTSIVLSKNETSLVQNLEHVQGHSLQMMLDNYMCYV